MSILVDVIPERARKYVYAFYAFVGLVFGALAVAGVDVFVPLNVYSFVGVAVGLTAYGNTNGGDRDVASE